MWRKFLGVGIPLVVVGGIMWIAALVKVGDVYYGGSGDGLAALLIIGEVIALVGISLTSAGLIGAAIRAEDITEAVNRGFAHLSKQLAALSVAQAAPGAAPEAKPEARAETRRTMSSMPGMGAAVRQTDKPAAAVGAATQDRPTGRCPQCGHPAEPDDGFCGKCGHNLKA
jgi:hypothetical protein